MPIYFSVSLDSQGPGRGNSFLNSAVAFVVAIIIIIIIIVVVVVVAAAAAAAVVAP